VLYNTKIKNIFNSKIKYKLHLIKKKNKNNCDGIKLQNIFDKLTQKKDYLKRVNIFMLYVECNFCIRFMWGWK